MGWERKRGKIEEFNRLLRGAHGHVVPRARSATCRVLPHVRYCLTLDSDTAAAARRRRASWSASSRIRSTGRASIARSGRVTEATGSSSRA